MKLLEVISTAFINTFGITQPSRKDAQRASRFITILLMLVVLLFLVALSVAVHLLNRR